MSVFLLLNLNTSSVISCNILDGSAFVQAIIIPRLDYQNGMTFLSSTISLIPICFVSAARHTHPSSEFTPALIALMFSHGFLSSTEPHSNCLMSFQGFPRHNSKGLTQTHILFSLNFLRLAGSLHPTPAKYFLMTCQADL